MQKNLVKSYKKGTYRNIDAHQSEILSQTYVCVCVYVCVCMCVCARVQKWVRVCMWGHAYVHERATLMPIYMYIHTYIYIRVHIHTYIHTCMYVTPKQRIKALCFAYRDECNTIRNKGLHSKQARRPLLA